MLVAGISDRVHLMLGVVLATALVLATGIAVGAQDNEGQDRRPESAEQVSLRELVRDPEAFDDQRVEVRGQLRETPMPAVYTLSARNQQVYVFVDPQQVPNDDEDQDELMLTGIVYEVTRREFNATFGLAVSRGEADSTFPIVVLVADDVSAGDQQDTAGDDEGRSTPVVSYVGTPVAEEAECLSREEEQFVRLINDYRREHELDPLDVAASLNAAAWKHSLDMGVRGYFSHRTMRPLPPGLTGPRPVDRMTAAGYDFRTAVGENIAAGPGTAEEVFRQWRRSPRHNEIMLDERFEVVGIGHVSVEDSRYVDYWTADFGGHAAPAPDC